MNPIVKSVIASHSYSGRADTAPAHIQDEIRREVKRRRKSVAKKSQSPRLGMKIDIPIVSISRRGRDIVAITLDTTVRGSIRGLDSKRYLPGGVLVFRGDRFVFRGQACLVTSSGVVATN